MSEPQTLSETRSWDRAVLVQACEPGWDPRTVVRHVVWQDDAVHEELVVFASLREALDYAQEAFVSEDGPALVEAPDELVAR